MKLAPVFATTAAVLLLAGSAFADELLSEQITITGTIQQPPPTQGAAAIVYPVTIANILTVLGLSTDPKTLRYYYDNTLHAIVIAPKGLKSKDDNAPTIIFAQYGSTYGTDYTGGKLHAGLEEYAENPTILQTSESGAATVNLTSRIYVKYAYGSGHETDTTTLLSHGTIGSTNTIISAKIKDSFSY